MSKKMKWIQVFKCICAVLLISVFLTGCGNNNTVVDTTDDFSYDDSDTVYDYEENGFVEEESLLDDFAFAFALPDLDGKRLIVLMDQQEVNSPERIDLAISQTGAQIDIRYIGYQEGDIDAFDYRDMSYNFDVMSGHIYEVINGEVEADETHFLCSYNQVSNAIIPFNSIFDKWMWEFESASAGAISKAVSIKNRAVEYGNRIAYAQYGDLEINQFKYVRIGDDMLFSIICSEGSKDIVLDFPAEYDEYSTWRVDCGDDPGNLNVLFLARIDDKLVMATAWGAPEGESASIWVEGNGEWIETELCAYRYWAPF